MPLQERCSESLLVHPLLASFRLAGAASGVWWRKRSCCSRRSCFLAAWVQAAWSAGLEGASPLRGPAACIKQQIQAKHINLFLYRKSFFLAVVVLESQSLGRLLTHKRTFRKVLGRDVFQLVSASAQSSGCRALVCRRPVATQVPGHAVRARPFIFHSLQL